MITVFVERVAALLSTPEGGPPSGCARTSVHQLPTGRRTGRPPSGCARTPVHQLPSERRIGRPPRGCARISVVPVPPFYWKSWPEYLGSAGLVVGPEEFGSATPGAVAAQLFSANGRPSCGFARTSVVPGGGSEWSGQKGQFDGGVLDSLQGQHGAEDHGAARAQRECSGRGVGRVPNDALAVLSTPEGGAWFCFWPMAQSSWGRWRK